MRHAWQPQTWGLYLSSSMWPFVQEKSMSVCNWDMFCTTSQSQENGVSLALCSTYYLTGNGTEKARKAGPTGPKSPTFTWFQSNVMKI